MTCCKIIQAPEEHDPIFVKKIFKQNKFNCMCIFVERSLMIIISETKGRLTDLCVCVCSFGLAVFPRFMSVFFIFAFNYWHRSLSGAILSIL